MHSSSPLHALSHKNTTFEISRIGSRSLVTYDVFYCVVPPPAVHKHLSCEVAKGELAIDLVNNFLTSSQ